MFIRTKTTPRNKNISVQIVETIRSEGKIKQRIIRHIGTAASGKELENLKQIAQRIMAELKRDLSRKQDDKHVVFDNSIAISDSVILNGGSLEEMRRIILGIHDIYGYIYNHLGFDNLFSKMQNHKHLTQILREIVLARIANPQSKRASVQQLNDQFSIFINLDHVYQMMDKIDDNVCENIQKYALSTTLQLTGEKLKVLFYDVTTLYFESFTENDLMQNGYSKDLKFNQPQVLLALCVTHSGLPVGYELFPGSTFEGHTLIFALNKLKKRYLIDQVVIVADRGMLSEGNLHVLEQNKCPYIVGAKLKALDEIEQQKVIDWINTIKKEDIMDEVTHRILINPPKCSVKILLNNEDTAIYPKIKKLTYILSRNNDKWLLHTYKDGQQMSTIQVTEVHGLLEELAAFDAKNKLPRHNIQIIKKLILMYHQKPRTLILIYRTKRAQKDRADREKAIQKLQIRLKKSSNPKQLVSKYGFQKFIKVSGDAKLEIDEAKLIEETIWDGVFGIYTSDPNLTDKIIVSHYRGLWQVEESFRLNKHDLKIRPIYHWTPQRIKAHMAIAFMAFVCVRYLEYRIAHQSKKISPQVIRGALLQVQGSFIVDKGSGKTYLLSSKMNSDAQEIYRIMGVKKRHGFLEIKNKM